jgi:hypothetical protein
MDLREPESCTVELVHGGWLHVAMKPSEVRERIWNAENAAQISRGARVMVTLRRSSSFITRQAQGFEDVDVNPQYIVGIFPLQTGSDRLGHAWQPVEVRSTGG